MKSYVFVARCRCAGDYTGPECAVHRLCDTRVNENVCSDPHYTFCTATSTESLTCSAVSRVFAKYKFAEDSSAVTSNGACSDSECRLDGLEVFNLTKAYSEDKGVSWIMLKHVHVKYEFFLLHFSVPTDAIRRNYTKIRLTKINNLYHF